MMNGVEIFDGISDIILFVYHNKCFHQQVGHIKCCKNYIIINTRADSIIHSRMFIIFFIMSVWVAEGLSSSSFSAIQLSWVYTQMSYRSPTEVTLATILVQTWVYTSTLKLMLLLLIQIVLVLCSYFWGIWICKWYIVVVDGSVWEHVNHKILKTSYL